MAEQSQVDPSGLKKNRSRNVGDARAAIDRLIALAEEAVDTNPAQALLLSEQAAAACRMHPFEKRPYLKGLARNAHAAATAYVNQGDYGEALKYHSSSLALYRELGDHENVASQLNNIGTVYAYCGDYAEALKHFRAAEANFTERTKLVSRAQILNNIGFTYVSLGEHASAIPILLESLKAARKMTRPGQTSHLHAQANIYDSLCQAYLAQNDLPSALRAARKSTGICRQIGDLKKEAEYLLILGDVFYRMGQSDEAENQYQLALGLAREHGFRREQAEACRRLGKRQGEQGNFELARQLLLSALTIAEENKTLREVYECHFALAGLYKAAGEFQKALEHYEHFHQIKELVFNDQSDQRIKHLEILHQVEQARRDAEIHQQKSVELQKEILERKKAHELAEILASTDALTGIYNRRHFFSLARNRIADALQANTPLCLIILDIDHFKAINDQFGHMEGDRVLAAVARKIQSMLRTEDILARYGGEEFIAALPQTTLGQAVLVAERLRAGVESLGIFPAHPELQVTVSLGIAELRQQTFAEEETVLETLLSQADQAMYMAKREGRNRVQVFFKQ